MSVFDPWLLATALWRTGVMDAPQAQQFAQTYLAELRKQEARVLARRPRRRAARAAAIPAE